MTDTHFVSALKAKRIQIANTIYEDDCGRRL